MTLKTLWVILVIFLSFTELPFTYLFFILETERLPSQAFDVWARLRQLKRLNQLRQDSVKRAINIKAKPKTNTKTKQGVYQRPRLIPLQNTNECQPSAENPVLSESSPSSESLLSIVDADVAQQTPNAEANNNSITPCQTIVKKQADVILIDTKPKSKYFCAICDKSFGTSQSLYQHKRTKAHISNE